MREQLESLVEVYINYNRSTLESLRKDNKQNFLSEVERNRRSANVSVLNIVIEDLTNVLEKGQTK